MINYEYIGYIFQKQYQTNLISQEKIKIVMEGHRDRILLIKS